MPSSNKKKKTKTYTAQQFDEAFENDTDCVMEYMDLANVRVEHKIQRINIDFPISFLEQIDAQANKIGVARTALIKMWLAERLEQT